MSVLDYLRGVFWTWMSLVAGLLMVAIGVYERVRKPLSRLTYASVLVVLLLVSPYFLLRDQTRITDGLRARVQALARDCVLQSLTNDSLNAEIARGPRLASDAAAARMRATRDRLGAFVKEGNSILAALTQPPGGDITAVYERARAWTANVRRYLLACEDKSYEPEFTAAVGVRYGSEMDVESAMEKRLRVLQKFIDGLREKEL